MADFQSRSQRQPPQRYGVIASGEVYTREELQWRLGWEDAALRSARRSGLRCHRRQGRAFYSGLDVIRYLTSDDEVADAGAINGADRAINDITGNTNGAATASRSN